MRLIQQQFAELGYFVRAGYFIENFAWLYLENMPSEKKNNS